MKVRIYRRGLYGEHVAELELVKTLAREWRLRGTVNGAEREMRFSKATGQPVGRNLLFGFHIVWEDYERLLAGEGK